MTARKGPNIANYFSGAKQSQQLIGAEEEIQQLKGEIEQLRSKGSIDMEAQIQVLRSQLQSQSGILSVPIEQIQPNSEQPRQTFSRASIDSMSRSLKQVGQLQPIIVIQREDSYLLFDGERRWRSAQTIMWKTLQAVVIPEINSVELHRKALLTSLHREDLNALDKAEAILREITTTTAIEAQDAPRILSTAVRRLKAQKRMSQVVELISATTDEQKQGLISLGLEGQEQDVLLVLLDLQLNPASIDANIFPMLSLADDLKATIRESEIFGVHALSLSKLSAKNLGQTEAKAKSIRVKATQKVVDEKLSVKATRKVVAEIIASYAQTTLKTTQKVEQVSAATENLQKLSGEILVRAEHSQLIEFQEVLRQKLAEIEAVLNQN